MNRVDDLQKQEVPTSSSSLWSGTLTDYEDFQCAGELYRRVFSHGQSGPGLNSNLLSALVHNGGSAVGIKTGGGELIGFAYGFMGADEGGMYHYSQATVIDCRFQGLGVGRMLKYSQRRVALAHQVSAMRWMFNPCLGRNGHFNFNSLGATGVGFAADYYGRHGTDRVEVQWELAPPRDPYRDERLRVPPEGLKTCSWGELVDIGGRHWLPIPSEPAACAGQRHNQEVGARLRHSLHQVFDQGYRLVSCQRVSQKTSAYLAVPSLI